MSPQKDDDTRHVKKFLIDETPFVYVIGRGNNTLNDRLKKFLNLGRRKNKDRRYRLLMPYICKKRLGMYPLYRFRCFARSRINFLCPDATEKQALIKRLRRTRYAKSVVEKCVRKNLWTITFHSKIFDLYMHANEAKSTALEKIEGRKMEPNELIPLETCHIAEIAHRKGMTLLSYNTDFRYFANFHNEPHYVHYQNLEDFLETDFREE